MSAQRTITTVCIDADGKPAPLLLSHAHELPAAAQALLNQAYEGENAFYLLADDGAFQLHGHSLRLLASQHNLLEYEIEDAAWLQAACEAGYCVWLSADTQQTEHDLAAIALWDFERINHVYQHESWLDIVVVCVHAAT